MVRVLWWYYISKITEFFDTVTESVLSHVSKNVKDLVVIIPLFLLYADFLCAEKEK